MDPVPKRLIREQNIDHDDINGEDLISSFTDCVLAHILSKLPTKFAVGTAILSTKWKHLSALIPQPDIDLDDSLIIHPDNNSESDSERRLQSFADFSNRVLNEILKEEDVLEWISAAVRRSVMILDISSALNDLVEFVFELISGSTSLLSFVMRHLSICGPPSHPPCRVPNLRYILFDNVTFSDDECIPRILSGCRMLYSLTLCHCSFFDMEVVNISSQSLKHLSIESCFCNPHSTYTKYFVLNAPALERFYFKDCVITRFEFENLDSVRTADIMVLPVEGMDDEDTLSYHQHATEFVGEFYFSKDTISVLQKSGEQIPIFSNLIKLHLGGFDTNGWKLLPRLLKNAPNLKHLCILEKFYEEKGCYKIFKSHWADTFPACLLSTLEKIEIFGFQGEMDERRLVSYFLALGKEVLKKLEITCDMSSQMVQIFKHCVESHPELSETCEIIFSNKE